MTPEEALAYGRAIGEQTIQVLTENDPAFLEIANLFETVDKIYDQLVAAGIPAINVSAFISQMVAYRASGRVAGAESSKEHE